MKGGVRRPLMEGGNHAATSANILNNKGVSLINLLEEEELPYFSVPFEPGVAVTGGSRSESTGKGEMGMKI